MYHRLLSLAFLMFLTGASFASSPSADTTVTLPFVCNFEDTVQYAQWHLVNGSNSNAWFIGTASLQEDSHCLYISSDSGAHNIYNVNAAGLNYAYVDLNVNASGNYEYGFDWKAEGETTYDYLRVALVSSNEQLVAISGASVPSGFSVNSLPESWIPLDGGYKLNLDSTWSHYSGFVSLSQPGIFHLVFVWRNDASDGSQPPVAIDNVMFGNACGRPDNLVVRDIQLHSARITWRESGNATQWQYALNDGAFCNVSDTTILLSGLNAGTNYSVEIRSICPSGDTSFSSTIEFVTRCESILVVDSLSEDFEGLSSAAYDEPGALPSCWDAFSNGSDASFAPHVVNRGSSYHYCHSGTGALTMTSGSQLYGDTSIVVLPLLTQSLDSVSLTFWYIMEDVYHGSLTLGYVSGTDFSTDFVPLRSLLPTTTFTLTSFSFDSMPAQAWRYALRWTNNGSFYSCAIDDVLLTAVDPCAPPSSFVVSSTYQSAHLGWSGNASLFEVALRTDDDSIFGHEVWVDSAQFDFIGLQPATRYFYRVRQVCDSALNIYSDWVQGQFVTDSMPCLSPSQFQMTSVSSNSASFAWIQGGLEEAWEIQIYNNSFQQNYVVYHNHDTLTGLSPNTTYYAIIRSLCGANHSEEGEWSAPISFATLSCGAVSHVNAVPSLVSITVTWSPSDNNSYHYQIAYGFAGSSLDNNIDVVTVDNDSAFTFDNLAQETSYRFNVRAICGDNWYSDWSPSVVATTEAIRDLCDTVGHLSATADQLDITLSWLAGENNFGTWEIEYGHRGFALGQGVRVTSHTTSYTFEALEPVTAYDFFVRAICNPEWISGWSSRVSATTGTGVGIYDLDGRFNCSIYPNPASDMAIVSLTGVNGMLTIALVDMCGRTISAQALLCSADVEQQVHLSHLSQGTYFVRIFGDNVNSVMKLIVR